jgi:hypothetical protein
MKKNPSKPARTPGHLPSPPPELKQAGRELWTSVINEFVVDDAGSKTVLKEICRSADLIADCREQIAREGLTIPTRNGVRDHPLIRTILMSQSFVTRSLIRLGAIADSPKPTLGRPPGMGNLGVGETFQRRLMARTHEREKHRSVYCRHPSRRYRSRSRGRR